MIHISCGGCRWLMDGYILILELYRFELKVFGDLLQGFVFGFGQVKVEVHEPNKPYATKQHKCVVEADKLLEVHVKLGHEEAEEEIHRGTYAATQVFASGIKKIQNTNIISTLYNGPRIQKVRVWLKATNLAFCGFSVTSKFLTTNVLNVKNYMLTNYFVVKNV